MEDNKLNFNRPLLSVRRFSSTVTSEKEYSKRKNGSSLPTISPSSSYKSGSMRNAGTVPFVWEHSPGNPKHESKTQKHTKNLIPNLPPGRILKPKKQSPQSAFPLEVKFTEFDNSKEKKKEPSHSQVPQNLPRKQLEVKKVVVNRENERPQITYGPNFLQFTGDDSEEDSDFDDNEHVNTSYKVCGLLPHFCLKGSIGLLNPLPGLSVRTRLPVSSANKTHPGSSSSSSSSTSSQPARVAVYEHRSLAKQEKEQTTLKNESTEATNQKNSQNLEQSGPSDHLQDLVDSENKEVNLQKKGLISFKELLAVENEDEASLQNHMVEKTLYVDTIHKVETPKTCENNKGVFGISHIANEPLLSDLPADESKHDNGMITEMEFCEDPKVDQDLKVLRKSELELPAPPPLPKSPSDSWLWRTLPSVSSKAPSSRSRAKPEKFELRNTQGQLLPIPEI